MHWIYVQGTGCFYMKYCIDDRTITLRKLDSTMYQKQFYYPVVRLMLEQSTIVRAVTKISSCPVNKTRKQGIKLLGIFFGSIFLLFFYESSRGKSLAPSSLNDNPDCTIHGTEVWTVDNVVHVSTTDLLWSEKGSVWDNIKEQRFLYLKRQCSQVHVAYTFIPFSSAIPIVGKLAIAIHWINHYPVDKYLKNQICVIHWMEIYTVWIVLYTFWTTGSLLLLHCYNNWF